MVRKRMLLSVVVVGMFCSAALAIAPMGPPMAGLDQGKYAAMIGYAHSDMTLEVSGPITGVPGGEKVLNDVQHNMYFVGLGYGVSNDWEIYGAIGFANAEFPGDTGAPDFDGDNGFSFGIGTKRTLAEDGDTKWGILGQYSQGKSEDNVRVPSASFPTWGNGAIDLGPGGSIAPPNSSGNEVQIAVGPTVPLSEDVCVYGGPFLHFAEGDLEGRGGGSSDRDEYDLEQKLQLGAYVGTLISLGDPNASLMAELLYTGEGWGFGIAAMFKCP